MPSRTILILGGALSGPTAAARARETDESARIVMLERARDVSYAVGGLAYHLSGEVKSAAALNRERSEFFRDVYRVEVRTGVAVSRLDAASKVLAFDAERIEYDALVYSAGAESAMPEVPGFSGAANVFAFRTLRDLEGILACLRRGARRVAILGGGFFGVEAADAFLRRRCRVTIVERGPRILPKFGDGTARAAAAALEEAGAEIAAGVELKGALAKRGRVSSLELSDGRSLKADLVVVAAGLRPRTALLKDAGARVLDDGTVAIDDACRTSLPGVFACGVCVSLPHAVTGKPAWFAQAAQADKTAQVAGANAAGGAARVGPALGTAILRAGGLTLARTGLTGAEAGPYAATVRVQAPSHDPFFPSAETLAIELTYDRGTGRVLGAEIAGRAGADKRADVLATAILGGMTVEQLAMADLAYSPPYSAARDPVNVAGTVAAAAREGKAAPWSPAEVAGRGPDVAVVDVRTDAERRSGTIPGAQPCPFPTLRRRLGALPATGRLVFVSGTGRRGYLAARIARAAGRTEAGYLSGGMDSWVAEGRELAKGGRR
jgi:NADPH-dependent 2,4-dienoyl-CoA reductase/sulfur reductase-like enzyme/rhodanese-related sulfurtransferase